MRKITLFLAVVLIIAALVTAQSRSGVQGIVTDASKNELPGVTITLTNQQTKTTNTTVTNAAGRYQFQVQAGLYEIIADLKGFERQRLTNLEVKEGSTPARDFVMMIAPRN